MKLNYFTKRLSTVGRWLATTLFCVSAIAFVWQGAFFSNTAAMASPAANLIAAADAGDQVKEKYRDDVAEPSKNFIEDTKNKVKEAANKNASRVDQSTDDSDVAGKAKRDRDRIEKRADEDAARTKEAVDDAKNVVERTIDSIKGAFSD
ncbi:hypothetical protein NDI37_14915 [Funiculus sociatus GB2-A5]|uniref:Uncharacterized protein n=1 Tax=Funiculus sociatus GB2-A5 TaxID=2933946 RepID=A0ABV0JR85_9CYAN|nr:MULTISPECIES: hypothetical protein [unclassified Trichocoleus]MBD1906726.1 hypothetical protein [Trichocoleus sp. FACHB-832]MBD2063163.1 hypothetical protein [Trichocoleus sp. FACHB-6]